MAGYEPVGSACVEQGSAGLLQLGAGSTAHAWGNVGVQQVQHGVTADAQYPLVGALYTPYAILPCLTSMQQSFYMFQGRPKKCMLPREL